MEAARAAREDDLARLGELAAEALAEASSRRGGRRLVERWQGIGTGQLSLSLTAYLTEADRGLWAGTIDGQIVGVAAARGETGAVAALDLIFVEPEARGVGVGECLLAASLGWLEARGCTGVDAPALPGDRHTKQFFESAGMVARLLTMHRDL